MSNYRVETGIQFLARIKKSKSNLQDVDKILFPEGLKEYDVVELSAETTYSKNVILMYLMRKIILVNTYDGIPIGGLNTSVLFIDTAFQLKFNMFISYLEDYLNKNSIRTFSTEKINEIVRKSLENVIVIQCYDSEQLFVTFNSLHTLVTSNPKIKLIVLDNVGANYWQDFFNGGIKHMLLYEKKVISVLQNHVKDFKLPIIYIRPDFFFEKNPLGNDIAAYKIRIKEKNAQNSTYEVAVTSKITSNNIFFMISNNQITWV